MKKNRSTFLAIIIAMAMFLSFQEALAEEELPNDSASMRKLVEAKLSEGSDDEVSGLLVKIMSSDAYKDINDWAIKQYYGLAQKKDGILPATEKLEAVAKNSDSVSLQRGIAEGYVRQGDWAKVAEVYEKLVKENPDDSVFSTRLVDAYMLSRNYDAAIGILEQKVTANPLDTASSDILAQAYVAAHKADEAVALYKQKIAKNPGSPGLRGRYAQGLLDLGMPEESLAEWEAAFKLDPRNLLFKQRIAEIHAQMGNTRQAKKEYTELLNLIPAGQAAFKDSISSKIKDIEAAEKK